jgi:L-iditol 2-dehydrogenase
MIAGTYVQGGDFQVELLPIPQIGEGEVLLRVRATSVCGTDLKIVRKGHLKLQNGQKITLGHEFVGEIAELGTEVESFRIGQRVGVVPNIGCGDCKACRQQKANYCPSYRALGITMDGTHAEFVRIPEDFLQQGNVVAIPDGVTDETASLLEPFSCVVSGIRASRIAPGDVVAVFGAGPIGLLHVSMAFVSGASQVIAVDVRDERLARARNLTGCRTLNPERESAAESIRDLTGGIGADVIITACSIAAVQQQAVALLAPFGRLCFFGGLPKGDSQIRIDSNLVHYRNLILTGTTGGSLEDYRTGLDLVESGRIDLGAIVSDRFTLSEMTRAYAAAGGDPLGKVVLIADEARP